MRMDKLIHGISSKSQSLCNLRNRQDIGVFFEHVIPPSKYRALTGQYLNMNNQIGRVQAPSSQATARTVLYTAVQSLKCNGSYRVRILQYPARTSRSFFINYVSTESPATSQQAFTYHHLQKEYFGMSSFIRFRIPTFGTSHCFQMQARNLRAFQTPLRCSRTLHQYHSILD